MNREYIIRINDFDLGQLVDGLEVRARAWRDTDSYLETGQMPHGDFVMEECDDAGEARKLADHYERIIDSILKQKREQDL